MSTTIKRLRKKLQDQIDFRLTNEVAAAERIAALKSQLDQCQAEKETLARSLAHISEELNERRSICARQAEEIARHKTSISHISTMWNTAETNHAMASRALVLQVLATHEKPATQKPS